MATKSLPKTLGGCADRLYRLRDEKKKVKATLDALDEEYKALKEHIIQNLPKDRLEGVTGRVANAQIKKKDIPHVKNWNQFYAYVKRTNNFALLQRRVSEGAVKEIWEDRKKIPGVEPFTTLTVSVTKKR